MTKKDIYNRLMATIRNPYGVCGLMGNIKAESSMRSNNMQNSYETKLGMNDITYTKAVDDGSYTMFTTDRVGYGFCQWTSAGRKAALLAFAKQRGTSISDEEMQLDFLLYELRKSYKSVLSVLESAKSVKEASDIVVTKFEMPRDQSEVVLKLRASYGQSYYDELVEVSNMKNKKVALDCGHGLKTKGKQTPDGIKEWTLNDKVRDKVVALLKDYNVDFIFPDNDEGYTDESLTSRRTMYVSKGVDAFVSIHHNAYTGDWNNATGVEIYTDKGPTSEDKALANAIYKNFPKYTGLKGRGIKEADFTVINQDSIPAVLVEGGFMDSKKDYKVITSEVGQDAYARAVAEGLIEFLGLTKITKKPTVKPTVSDSFVVGETVIFNGSKHYTSSNASVGSDCKPGKAKVTNVSKGAKHPYHLVRILGDGSTVYGWVDTKDIVEFTEPSDIYYPKYKGTSTKIDEVLEAIGVPSKYCGSYTKRKPIAIANGIKNYSGTAIQNTRLIDLATKGMLIKC